MKNYILNTISEVNLYNYFYLGEEISTDVEDILKELLGFNEDGTPYNESLANFDTITYNDFRKFFIGNKNWRIELFSSLLSNVYTIGNHIIDITFDTYGMERPKDYRFAIITDNLHIICQDQYEFRKLVKDTNLVIKKLLNVNSDVNFVLFKVNLKKGYIDFKDVSGLFAVKAPGLFEAYFGIETDKKISIDDVESDKLDLAYCDYFYALTDLIEKYEEYHEFLNQ